MRDFARVTLAAFALVWLVIGLCVEFAIYLRRAMPQKLGIRSILAIAAIAYAGWTPLYFLTKPERVVPPSGERVERLLPTRISDEAGRIVRGFGFRQRENEVESSRPFVVYEGSDPLPSDHYVLAPFNAKNRWRVVAFRTSDESDPRYNGRSYYAVMPGAE